MGSGTDPATFGVGADILAPRVIIIPNQTPCPVVSGAGVFGMLCMSGSCLHVVSNNAGLWKLVGLQTAS